MRTPACHKLMRIPTNKPKKKIGRRKQTYILTYPKRVLTADLHTSLDHITPTINN